jgi:hypothetical protein
MSGKAAYLMSDMSDETTQDKDFIILISVAISN